MRADLHLHSTASDGAFSPSEVVARAAQIGMGVISLTDHDTVGGVDEAMEAAREHGIICIPGIEISTFSNCEIHILGYDIDYKNPEFEQELSIIKDMRRSRNIKIGQKLKEAGVHLDYDFSAHGTGRMNIARAMTEQGIVRDVNEAFDRYLGPHGKAYTESKRLTPVQAVRLIDRYDGISVIAHPKRMLAEGRLRMLAEGLMDAGLGGIETCYPTHTPDDVLKLNRITDRLGLLKTGGSDYHGEDDRRVDFVPDGRLLRRLQITVK